MLKPFTRDTFSSCIKATYCEINESPYPIFKNPKDGGFKKSQKGCCGVTKNNDGTYSYQDEFTWKDACENPDNELVTVFKDGVLLKKQSLQENRGRLHDGKF